MSNLIRQDRLVVHPGEPADPAAVDKKPDLREYAGVFWKRKWVILATALTVLAIFALHSFTTTPLYRSTAQIQMDPESDQLLPFKDFSTDQTLAESYLRTQYNVLQSRAMALRVVRRLRLAEDPDFPAAPPGRWESLRSRLAGLFRSAGEKDEEDAPSRNEELMAERLRANLSVSPVQGTRLINISYSSHDPELAARVVNSMAEEAIAHYFETQYTATNRAADFLQEQLLDMQRKVEASEEQLLDYARENNLFNLDEGQNLVKKKLELLSEELTRTEAELIKGSVLNEVIQQASVENFPQILKDETIVTLEARLFQLEQRRGSLASQFGPEWPNMVQLQEEIAQVKAQLAAAKRDAIQQARIDWNGLLERREKLRAALQEEQALAEDLSATSIQYHILKREAETNKQIYEALLQRVKEAGITTGLKSSKIHIVDLGSVPKTPFVPDHKRNLFRGLLLGLVLGLACAFLLEHLDNSIKTPEEVEQHLGLPSLGLIPLVSSNGKSFPALGSRSSGTAVVLAAGQDSRSRIWETYRSLRTSILMSHSGRPPQTILVTSSLRGEGKTTSVANLGVVLAQTGARTLLIDLDMRKPDLLRQFGMKGNLGMSNFLSGNADLSSHIRQTNTPNLYVVHAGTVPPNPAELIGSERMESALLILREFFKYLVIDSPPVLAVTDPLVVSPLVDGVVLVVHGGKTPRDAVRKTEGQLRHVGAKILGVTLNKLNLDKSPYGYYYQHYDYYYPHDFPAAAASQNGGRKSSLSVS